MPLELLSIELTNRCSKACWFCYNHSQPAGSTEWSVGELFSFIQDCIANGVKAVSFGGGEPLQFEGLFELLRQLRGKIFRSLTTNGLLLEGELLEKLVEARPDKVHLSIHFPERQREVDRVIQQVINLQSCGIRSGVNLLVAKSQLEAATIAAKLIRDAGVDNQRITYLPMRGADTPTPEQLAEVAGRGPFQSMTCLRECGKSARFASIGWDRTAAWCSYTESRRPLQELTYRGLLTSLENLGVVFCGGKDDERTSNQTGRFALPVA